MGSGSASSDSMSDDCAGVCARRELKFTKEQNEFNEHESILTVYVQHTHRHIYMKQKAREHPAEEPKPSHLLNENVSIVWVNVAATYVSIHIDACVSMCACMCVCVRVESGQTKTSSSS